jgi:hypothetical protein
VEPESTPHKRTLWRSAVLSLASAALTLHLAVSVGRAQELEPRALTNVPVGTNFVALGYAYAQGNILLDPAIPVEDLDSKLHTFIGAYVRALDFFGLSSKSIFWSPSRMLTGKVCWRGRTRRAQSRDSAIPGPGCR